MSRSVAIAACLLWTGCVDRSVVALPELAADVRSLVLVVTEYGEPVAAAALDPGDEGSTSVGIDIADENREAYLLLFGCSPQSLGLPLGPIPLMQPGEDGWALPTTHRAFRISLGPNDEGEDWVFTDTFPTVLVDLPRPEPCATFESTVIRPPDSKDVGAKFAVPVDEDSALVGLEDGRFFRVYLDGTFEPIDLGSDVPNRAGYRAPSGEIWLIGEFGEVARGDLEHGFQPAGTTATSTRSPTVWVGGAEPGNPFEMYVVTDPGSFERFDGESWTILDWVVDSEKRAGSITWLGPGHVLAIGVEPYELATYEDGQLTYDAPFSQPGVDYLSALVDVPGYGIVIGTNRGLLRVRRDGKWGEVDDRLGPELVRGAVRFRSGAVLGGKEGVITELIPGLGLCPEQLVTVEHISKMVRFGPGFIVLSNGVYAPRTNAPEDAAFAVVMPDRPGCGLAK